MSETAIITKPKVKRESHYIKLGTKSTGRPRLDRAKTEDINEIRNAWNKKWHEGRGKLILSIRYMSETYEIPSELLAIPSETEQDLNEKIKQFTAHIDTIKRAKREEARTQKCLCELCGKSYTAKHKKAHERSIAHKAVMTAEANEIQNDTE